MLKMVYRANRIHISTVGKEIEANKTTAITAVKEEVQLCD